MKNLSETLQAGDRAPDFQLPTAGGQIVGLADFRGSPLLIIFIRGTW